LEELGTVLRHKLSFTFGLGIKESQVDFRQAQGANAKHATSAHPDQFAATDRWVLRDSARGGDQGQTLAGSG
jgi:hypothetical protein